MSIEQIQNEAINTYNKNLEFLEKNNKKLFDQVKLFEEALSLNQIKERYILEYKEEGYFDVFDSIHNSWLYGVNSKDYSRDITKTITKEAQKNSFKTFYEFKFDDKVVENAKKASILSTAYITISPIVSYVQKNVDNKEEMKNIYKYFIFGIGLGIHIQEIHKKLKPKIYILTEPSLELFRLSLFVTNYSSLSSSKIHFAVGMNENQFRELVYILSQQTFLFDYYIKFFLFSKNCDIYINVIQNYLVSQSHIIYSFEREFQSLQRTYNRIRDGFKFLNISQIKEVLNKPTLILAMGPSLEKNIDFVKKNQKKFIILAIYATLPILEKNNIKPDIVVQYDQQKDIVLSTLEKVKSVDFFQDTIFLCASHIDVDLIKKLPENNIYFFQGIHEVQKGLGTITAPSVGEIAYAFSLIFGTKQVFLLGLDLALSEDRSTHSGDHAGAKAYDNIEERSNQNFSFKKNILKTKGNFRKEVETLAVFKSSIRQINTFTNQYKKDEIKVYNLSDGAYFNEIIPLQINSINKESLQSFNKELELKSIKNHLDSLSSSEYKEDINKYIDSNNLLRIYENFDKKKYSSFMTFQNELFKLYEDLIYCEVSCDELQKVLTNYFKHILPPIFYFINLKNINNPKKHIKQLKKSLSIQTKKIFEEYINLVNKK